MDANGHGVWSRTDLHLRSDRSYREIIAQGILFSATENFFYESLWIFS